MVLILLHAFPFQVIQNVDDSFHTYISICFAFFHHLITTLIYAFPKFLLLTYSFQFYSDLWLSLSFPLSHAAYLKCLWLPAFSDSWQLCTLFFYCRLHRNDFSHQKAYQTFPHYGKVTFGIIIKSYTKTNFIKWILH